MSKKVFVSPRPNGGYRYRINDQMFEQMEDGTVYMLINPVVRGADKERPTVITYTYIRYYQAEYDNLL